MEINLIALAIPVFFVMIAGEYAVARWRGRPELYRFTDAIADLSCGIGQQVVNLFSKVLVIAVYAWVWSRFRLFDLRPVPALHWAVGLVAYDFAYYWWHRFTHEVNAGWATHVVHHSSQDYNLAVALRQSMTGWVSSLPFYLPLALLGVDPLVFGISAAVSLLYQFWIHTEVIDKLPAPVELVLNTPAHHRVHHAINPEYLDKNYGAILILWDRLFGTFEPEVAEPVYGTVKPLDSFDPIWAQFAHFRALLDDTLAARTPWEKLRVWTSRPGWRPKGLPPYPQPAPITRAEQVKYDPTVPVGLMAYVAVQFAPVAVGLTALELVEDRVGPAVLAVAGALILWATWNWGALHERRPAALPSELLRLVASAAFALTLFPSPAWMAAVVVFAAASAVWVAGWNGWLAGRPAVQ